jgi:hypothetical protein
MHNICGVYLINFDKTYKYVYQHEVFDLFFLKFHFIF